MAEKKRTSDSSEDKVLDDMTNDFDDVFSEIKDKMMLNQRKSIRGRVCNSWNFRTHKKEK